MKDGLPSPRRNTAEEIRQLGATQSKARTRGFVALGAGVVSAALLAGAFMLLSRPAPNRLAAAPHGGEPADELSPAPEAPAPGAPSRPAKPGRRGLRRSRDPIANLAAPTQIERPAGTSAPMMRQERAALEDLARSLAVQKKGAVQLCFERELKRDPRLKGSATVTVSLEAPHRIGQVEVRDDLGRQAFTKCVRTAMRSLDFPTLSEDVTVELPFALKGPDF